MLRAGKSRIRQGLAGIAVAGIFAVITGMASPAAASGIEWEYRCVTKESGRTFVLGGRPVRDGDPVWHRDADEYPEEYRTMASGYFPSGSDVYLGYGYRIERNEDNETCQAAYHGQEMTGS